MSDNLFVGTDARHKLMAGVRKVANAVEMTLGTNGKNSLIEVIENPGHFATNDGFSIANSIKLSDRLEEIGRKILLESINRANKQSGDGSSTTCVLTSAILEEGMRHIGEASPMEMKRSLEECIPLIENSIKEQKREITVDNVGPVASISAEDEEIGNRIQEIYQKIGKEGIIQWDISKTAEDSYSIGTGLVMNGATYVSPYMGDQLSDTQFSTTANLKEPLVMLVREKITTGADFGTLFGSLYNKGIKEIAIFCDDIEVPAIVHLILTQQKRGFRSVVVKMPVLWKDEWWEDLALASGAKIIDAVSGIKLSDITEEHLGRFGHLKITKDDTFIDGIKDLTLHIANLQAEGSDASKLRASRLNTRTARYFVGAHSENALAYRRLKVEDAINAASCALEGGIVAGGGLALLNASKTLPNTIGGKILAKALKAPINQIIANTGLSKKGLWIKVKDYFNRPIGEEYGGTMGFDSRTGQRVDMFEAKIVDPADVVLNALRNAIGVAATILTIGTVITFPDLPKE